ncbi:recombinase family protein [Homoserinibacter sp. YIM 151385]|nr:recombinase family protein [Homoserinibacter sp. YIM 151385]WBU39401.1 recombinase family protein [Homoserinibacter sp. YIM 151385]
MQQQREDCTALAARLGYTRTIEFVDEAVSAYGERARPGYQQLLQRIGDAQAVTVIVWHLDRLYWRPNELEQLLDLLDTSPVRIEAVQGGSFDLNRHEGRLFARQLVAFANYESAHRGARVARAQQQRAGSGLLHGGSHSGYRNDGTLEPLQSGIVRRIVDDYLIGLSHTAIAHELAGDGVPAPRADRWNATTIVAILSSDRLHHRRFQRPAAKPIDAAWERLISDEESALVQLGLLLPPRDAGRLSTSLLGGILRCRRCGRRMVAGVTRFGRRIYGCRTATARCPGPSFDADLLDAQVAAVTLEQYTIAAAPCLSSPRDLLPAVRLAHQRLSALAAAFGTGHLDHSAYLAAREPLERALLDGALAFTAYRRARIFGLEAIDFHHRWAASLPFRRAVICGFLPTQPPGA